MFRQLFTAKNEILPKIINPESESLEKSELDVILEIWEKYSKDRPLKSNKNYTIIDSESLDRKTYQFTSDVKIITIDPLKLQDYQKKYLYSLFEIAGSKSKYSKDKLYISILPHHEKSPTVFFQLTHDIFFRRCNPDGKHEGEIRCEVISNDGILGKGTFGEVVALDATLAPTKDRKVFCKIKPEGKRRVVKVEVCDSHDKMLDIKREYLLSNMTEHLRPKEPVIYGNLSFFVMRRMEGVTLGEIIEKDCQGIKVLTAVQRIDLCIAILQALLDQVHCHDIIHRDIKINNIIVKIKPDGFDVKIIDYGISETLHDNKDPSHIGNFPYIAPELRAKLLDISSQKADIYSAARVLSQIFRVNLGTTNLKQFASKLWAEHEEGFYLKGLFDGICDISDAVKERIRKTLEGMGHANPEKRWTIKEAITELNNIKHQDLKKSEPKFFSLW